MPWQPADAARHDKKAKSAGAKKQWAAVANSVLARTGNEGRAVRQANAVIARRSHGLDTVKHYASGGLVSATSRAIEAVAGVLGSAKSKIIKEAEAATTPPKEPGIAGGTSNRARAIEAEEQRATQDKPEEPKRYAKGGPVNIHGIPIRAGRR